MSQFEFVLANGNQHSVPTPSYELERLETELAKTDCDMRLLITPKPVQQRAAMELAAHRDEIRKRIAFLRARLAVKSNNLNT